MKVLAALLLCLVIGTPSPPVASWDMGFYCAGTGCIPTYDGTLDYAGPSGWSIEGFWADGPSPWVVLPRRSRLLSEYVVYFSPSVHAWFPAEGEVPGDVCGGAGSIAACMCAWVEVTVRMRYTSVGGRVEVQTRTTPFMSGVSTGVVTFAPPAGARQAEVSFMTVMHFWFFGENLQPQAPLEYEGCVHRVVRLRPR